MYKFLFDIFNNKKLLILGFGTEGKSTYNVLREIFPDKILFIADQEKIIKPKNDNNITCITGKDYLKKINDFDIIIKSPGVKIENINDEIKNKITSQTDIFTSYYSKQIIGVTGTKGKSTTSSLIYHVIKLFTENVILVGNIGVPCWNIIRKVNDDTKIVFEYSAHQLEFIKGAPHISVILNFFKEHLDYYNSFKDYKNTKFNICRFQNKDDYFVYNFDDIQIKKILNKNNINSLPFGYSLKHELYNGVFLKDDNVVFRRDDREDIIDFDKEKLFLKGEHNLMNIMAAINVFKLLNIPDNIIIKGLESFIGLEHRIEFVGKYHNIYFYNDSIATIPEATIQAIKTLKYVDTLILGGFERNIDYTDLTVFLLKSDITNFVFVGQVGKRLYDFFKDYNIGKKYFLVNDYEQVVETAIKFTKPEKICLLSPASASYDMFKNFEERGSVYKKIVRNL